MSNETQRIRLTMSVWWVVPMSGDHKTVWRAIYSIRMVNADDNNAGDSNVPFEWQLFFYKESEMSN